MIKIFKNFLSNQVFENIKKTICNEKYFPWYCSHIISENDNKTQFVHTFFENSRVYSSYFDLLFPIFDVIKPFTLLRVKVNLGVRTENHEEGGMHIDYESTKDYKVTTGILYLNTNNGYTKLENNKKIISKENTYIEFSSNIKHTGVTCTDERTRIVLNLNYIKRFTNV